MHHSAASKDGCPNHWKRNRNEVETAVKSISLDSTHLRTAVTSK
jgi:hypothetical protein